MAMQLHCRLVRLAIPSEAIPPDLWDAAQRKDRRTVELSPKKASAGSCSGAEDEGPLKKKQKSS